MTLYGIPEAKHKQVIPNYSNWGNFGSTTATQLKNLHQIDLTKFGFLSNSIQLIDYCIAYAYEVEYYQGQQLPSIQAILVRLIKTNLSHLNHNLDGEHISFIYRKDNHQLLGYTCMQANQQNNLISHQEALNKACSLLKQFAPDLIDKECPTPQLNTLPSQERMLFKPALTIGNIELQWIDEHFETITQNGALNTISGMKVKMYLPQIGLWAWAIVDQSGQIITFERNVSWNFNQMKRETQMWLHDKWLIAHNIF